MEEKVVIRKDVFEGMKAFLQSQPAVQLLAGMQQSEPYVEPEKPEDKEE